VLEARDLRRPQGLGLGTLTLLATDGAERFARVGGTFLGQPVDARHVEIVDLGAYVAGERSSIASPAAG
jgi:hypothetical protein